MSLLKNLFLKYILPLCLTFLWCSSLATAKQIKPTLLYVPLDNRPVCSSYAVKTMEAAGYKILVPPEKYLASYNRNGNPEALWTWVTNNAPHAKAAIISSDSLIYGGLVASRTHQEPLNILKQRVERFNTLREQFSLPLYAFSTLMRTPQASFGNVEPPYYEQYGPAIFRHSQLSDKADINTLGLQEQLTQKALEKNIPSIALTDWLERRQKNFVINQELINMTRNYKFHFLAIGKDDNAPLSHTHMEARQLSSKTYDLSQQVFQIVPGVDQLGLLLLTRASNELERRQPTIYVHYASGSGRQTLPQYSDIRLGESIPQQILAADARPVATQAEADFVLAVNTPFNGIMMDSTAPSNQFFSSAHNRQYIDQLTNLLDQNTVVSLADVAYSNGADNGFMNELANQEQLSRLAAYNGWNTADNAIGYAIAQGILFPHMNAQDAKKLMQMRIIDDWFYQSNARRDANTYLQTMDQEHAKYFLGNYSKPIHRLALNACQDLATHYKFTKGTNFNIAFPWNRLFEIEVDLKEK